MLFKADVLEAIAAGRVTLAFRRWTRPSVRAGGTLKTSIGLLAIDAVDEVEEGDLSEEEARLAGYECLGALVADLRRRTDGRIYRIALRCVGEDPRTELRSRSLESAEERAALVRRLATLDRRSPDGPWTERCLRLIGAREGERAAELAEILGLDKVTAKRRIRRLKELGLTESLRVGYRLSPRGRSVFGGDRSA